VYSDHRPNFLWASSISRCQLPPSTSLAAVSLYVVSFAFDTVDLHRLLPLFSSENGFTPSPPLPHFHHPTDAIEVPPSLPLPLDRSPSATLRPYKRPMRAPTLSIAPTSAPISPPRTQNHLLIRAPSVASVERHRVIISAAPPSSGAIGENPDNLLLLFSLSLSLSYHDDLPSLGAATLLHDRESTMH
jgi:hypothetical protein